MPAFVERFLPIIAGFSVKEKLGVLHNQNPRAPMGQGEDVKNTMLFTAALSATLFACGSEKIIERKTEKEVVVTKVVFVCADQSQVEDPRTCPPGPIEEVPVYVCTIDGREVADPNMCPEWTLSCPEGTTAFGNTQTGERGCSYNATCHEGWAYEPSTSTCKKYCAPGETLDADGINCVNVYKPVVMFSHADDDGGSVRSIMAGEEAELFDLVVQTNIYGVPVWYVGFQLDLGVEVSGTIIWSPTAAEVLQHRIGLCILRDTDGRVVAGPSVLTNSSGEANVEFRDTFTVSRSKLLFLACETSWDTDEPFYVAARLVSIGAGEQWQTPDIRFAGLNNEHRHRVHVEPRPANDPFVPSGPIVSLATGSPSGAAVPSFNMEILRFGVFASIGESYEISGVMLDATTTDNAGTGWFDCNEMVGSTLLNVLDSGWGPQFVVPRCTKEGTRLHAVYSAAEGMHVVTENDPLTLSLRADTTRASASQDDVIRIDVVGLCWRDLVTAEDTCSSSIRHLPVIGGTLEF